MKVTSVNISEIAEHPNNRMDTEYWIKVKSLELGVTKVIIVQNIEGNDCEELVGCTGIVNKPYWKGCKDKDWYGVYLDNESIYGRQLNFHIDEIAIL